MTGAGYRATACCSTRLMARRTSTCAAAWARYSSRYSGAMVADVHRILLKGGVFLYPPTRKAPQGKLRLMYEANPMAMLIEQAGGKTLAGREQPIMAIEPTGIHQRTPVILGAADQVDQVLAHL
jgi:fructose-1,6-bisphosphatase I